MAEIIINDTRVPDIDLMIFDKDGTLMCVHRYWTAMVGFRAELICRRLGLTETERLGLMEAMGVDPLKGQLKPEGPVGIRKREVVLLAAADYLADRGWPEQAALCQEVFAEVDELSLGQLDRIIQPIQGLYRLFAAMEAANCKIAVATTDLSGRARLAMEHLGLDDRIAYIAGAEMVARSKPHPDLLELVLKELAVPPSRAAMVGDAITDVMMGVKAGLKLTIGVLSGLAPDIDAMKRITPHLVGSIADIKIKKSK